MKPWLLFILKKILPRATRNQRLKQLAQYRGSSLGLIKQSAYCIVAAYGYLSVKSFNKYLIAGELGVIIFCFAAFTGPTALFTIITAILITLTFRNAYLHHEFLARAEKPPARSRYYIDRGGDAVTMMVVLLGTQTLALHYAPSVVLPGPDLIRGTAICAPLIGILRASLRPEPPQEPERQMSQRSAMHIYIRTCVFNVLWMLSVYGLILQDVTDDPNSILDPFRGGLPLVTAGLIVIAGRNGLIRRDTLITLRTSPRKQKLARLKETLLQPVKPGQPGYWLCITFEYMLFAELAVSMAAGVWPWLSGQADGGSFLRVVSHLLAFAVSVLSWKYIKETNYAAAEAIQKAIEAFPAETLIHAGNETARGPSPEWWNAERKC